MENEDENLIEFIDNFFPPVPMLKIYRIEEDGKQTFLGSSSLVRLFSYRGAFALWWGKVSHSLGTFKRDLWAEPCGSNRSEERMSNEAVDGSSFSELLTV